MMLGNHPITYSDRKVGIPVPVLTGGYLVILDTVCLFGVMCTPAEDALHLRICCVAKLYAQRRTAKIDHGFINRVSTFPQG